MVPGFARLHFLRGWEPSGQTQPVLAGSGSGPSGWRSSTAPGPPLEGAAITSIAERIGCAAETFRYRVRQTERDRWPAARPDDGRADTFKQIERESTELRRADEILRLASAYFAKVELDRRAK